MQITLIMAMIISIMTTTATAQITAANFKTDNSAILTSGPKSKPEKTRSMVRADKAAYKADKADFKALSNFQNTYKDESSAIWSFEPNVIVARFTKDDIQTMVVYNKRGRIIHTIQIYNESKMPGDVRSLIKNSEYADFKIEQVQQIQEGSMTFYLVHLSYGKKYKEVAVFNGEINVYKEYDNQ